MNVTIHTIDVHMTKNPDNALTIMQRLLKNPPWMPDQLNHMATQTGGQQYDAQNYNAGAIDNIYKTIATQIHIKLFN